MTDHLDPPLSNAHVIDCFISAFTTRSGKLDGRIIFIDAGADGTRYHLCIATDPTSGDWWVSCENLYPGFSLPILPFLPNWNVGYIQSKLPDRNQRTAIALVWLMEFAHHTLNTWNMEFAARMA